MNWKTFIVEKNQFNDGYYILKNNKISNVDLPTLKSKLKRWNPLATILVADCQSSQFVTPPELDILKDFILKKIWYNYIFILIIILFCFLFLIYTFSITLSTYYLNGSLVFLLMLILCFVEYNFTLKKIDNLIERCKFNFYLQKSKTANLGLYICISFLILIAIVQYILQEMYGGLDQLVTLYGALFEKITINNEYWRLFTGAYFHSGIAHFIANAVLFILIGTICIACFGIIISSLVFICGNFVSVYAQYLTYPYGVDATVGISGGIIALSAYIFTCGFFNKNFLPSGFPIVLLIFSALTVAGSSLNSNDATFGHYAGLFTGIFIAFLYNIMVNSIQNIHNYEKISLY